jgi:hypothetical protein
MADSSDIDLALIAKLQADATLAALAAPGKFVFWDHEAPAGLTKFISVSLVDEHDVPIFEGTAHEDTLYLVKWVELSSSVKTAKAAAARIQDLLHLQPLDVDGYHVQLVRRESRIRMAEPLPEDPSKDWYHRGGRYQVIAAPIGT